MLCSSSSQSSLPLPGTKLCIQILMLPTMQNNPRDRISNEFGRYQWGNAKQGRLTPGCKGDTRTHTLRGKAPRRTLNVTNHRKGCESLVAIHEAITTVTRSNKMLYTTENISSCTSRGHLPSTTQTRGPQPWLRMRITCAATYTEAQGPSNTTENRNLQGVGTEHLWLQESSPGDTNAQPCGQPLLSLTQRWDWPREKRRQMDGGGTWCEGGAT